jgi:hypothetical protein
LDRKLLIVSTVMVLAGLFLMAYSDPAVRAGLGLTSTTTTTPISPRNVSGIFPGNFTFSGTFSRTFTGAFSIPAGGFTVTGRGVVISTTTQEEAFIGLGLVAVGLLLEAFTLFLWEPSKPTVETPGTGQAN